MSTEGTDLTPDDWPWVVTAGNKLPGETVDGLFVQQGEDGDEVELIITEAVATIREREERGSDLVAVVPVEHSGNSLTVGKDMVVPDRTGEFYWDCDVTGTVNGVTHGPITWYAGTWVIRAGLRETS